ncbi:uncharacterized protein LOC105194870 isoform X2 [Solenopsis invicta]|uniref:uncharacterized protein LOC105194870 isoform X2 n=1 Tax=Solenopsis invicta TaxID=13686 RepID=UPI0005959F15|nr:uncharacterized protein LOC105194870 isoform X2 [Solenopsis invicta]
MNSCERFMKQFLITINLVILIFATLVIIKSVHSLVVKRSRIREVEYNDLAAILIVSLIIGILTISMAIFGIVAAKRKAKCMLLTYAIVAIIASILLVIWISSRPLQHSVNTTNAFTLLFLLVLGKIPALVLYRSQKIKLLSSSSKILL